MTRPKRAPTAHPTTSEEMHLPGDPIPTAEAIERNSDTMWALWSDLVAAEDIGFADTVPVTAPGELPTPLHASNAVRAAHPPAAAHATVTLGEALVEARRNNRVCPQPGKWQQLYQMLTDQWDGRSGGQPALPLIGAAWLGTPALAKRMCFQDYLAWAAAHGRIGEVLGFLKTLPEAHWHHMGR